MRTRKQTLTLKIFTYDFFFPEKIQLLEKFPNQNKPWHTWMKKETGNVLDCFVVLFWFCFFKIHYMHFYKVFKNERKC